MKYRKKPVVVEAITVKEALELAIMSTASERLPGWLVKAYDDNKVMFQPTSIYIKTLEGTMCADYDDWIICGVEGEIYPCKPSIFEATYEPVE